LIFLILFFPQNRDRHPAGPISSNRQEACSTILRRLSICLENAELQVTGKKFTMPA
jgi:hypothetical protein